MHHVRKALHLYLTMTGNPFAYHVRKALHLHLTMIGNSFTHHVKKALSPRLKFLVTDQVPPFSQRMAFNAYIWSCENTSHSHLRMAQHSHLTMEGTNPLTMSEWLYPYIWPWEGPYIWSCGNTSHSHMRMVHSSKLSILGNWLGAYILPENGI